MSLLRSSLASALFALLAWPAAANPGNDVLERDRAGDPYIVPAAVYGNQLDFGPNTRLRSDYLGDPSSVIARHGNLSVTERDLYCFLLAAGHPNPTIFDDYRRAKLPGEAETLAREIRLLVRALVLTSRLAAGYDNGPASIDEKLIETMTMPAYQVAWTMAELEPRVNLEETDIVRAYRQNLDTFYRPARTEARIIWKRFDSPEPLREEDLDALSAADRRDAMTRHRRETQRLEQQARVFLEDVRQEVVSRALSFEQAAERYSDGPEARRGGLLPPFAAGALAPQLEAALERISAGEVTDVVPLPNGAAFGRLEGRTAARYLSYEEAREKAREIAFRQAVNFLFERELDFISPYDQVSDIRAWDDRPGDSVIVDASGYRLTKDEMLQLFPIVEKTHEFKLDEEELYVKAKWLAAAAHVRGRARARGLESDPVVVRTRQMASRIAAARLELAERLATVSTPEQALTLAYYEQNPELFTSAPRQHLVHVFASAKPEVPVEERAEVARQLLENFIAICERESRNVDVRLKSHERVAFEEAAMRIGYYRTPKFREGESEQYTYNPFLNEFPFAGLMPYTADAVRMGGTDGEVYRGSVDFADLGYVHTESIGGVHDQVRGTAIGAFSPIETRDGVASSFFVLDEQRPAAPPYDAIRPFVTREFALERRARAVSKLLDTYFDGSSTEYSFD